MPHRPGHIVDEQGRELSPPRPPVAPAPTQTPISERAESIRQNVGLGLAPGGGQPRSPRQDAIDAALAIRAQLQQAVGAEDVLRERGGTPLVSLPRNFLQLPEANFTAEIERTLFNLQNEDPEIARQAQTSFLGRLVNRSLEERQALFNAMLGDARDPGQASAALTLSAIQNALPGEQQLEQTARQLREAGVDTELAAVLATHNAPSGLPFGVVGTTEVLTDPLNILGVAGVQSRTVRGAVTAIADPTGGLIGAGVRRAGRTRIAANLDPRLRFPNLEDVPPGAFGAGGADPGELIQKIIPKRAVLFKRGSGTVDNISDSTQIVDDVVPTNVSNAGNPPTGGINADLHAGFTQGGRRRDWPDTVRLLNEAINERFYKLRSTLRKEGQESLINVSGSSYVQAQGRYQAVINEMKRIAPTGAWNDIDSFAITQMARNVFNNAEGRIAVGPITRANIDARLAAIEALPNSDQIERAAAVIRNVYRQERERLVDVGLLSREQANILREKYPWYNPINYADFVEATQPTRLNTRAFQSQLNRDIGSNFSLTDNAIRSLGKKGLSSNLQAPSEALFDALVRNQSRMNRNRVAQALIDISRNQGVEGIRRLPAGTKVLPDAPGRISFFRNGLREVYEVPDWMARQVSYLGRNYDEFSKVVGAINGISRVGFTTLSPTFIPANMMIDMATVWLRQGVGPHSVAYQLLRSISRIANRELDEVFTMAGGRQFRFFGKPTDMSRRIRAEGGKVATTFDAMAKAFNTIPAIGDAVEQAPRKATFQKSLNRSLPEWQDRIRAAENFDDRMRIIEEIASSPQATQAASEALESTLNFWRGGFLIKQANPFILFLNAALEGFKLPFRTFVEHPSSLLRLGGAMAGYAAMNAYNLSYPEYLDIPDDIRWGSILVMLPSTEKNADGSNKPNYLTVIPRTREWALFFGSQTYIAERLFAEHPTDASNFLKSIWGLTSPINSVPNVQILDEIFEQNANYDTFRQSPIVPPELEGLPTDQQFAPWTSETMRQIGERINVSPIRLDHAFHGITGGAGRSFTSVTDWIFHNLMEPEITPEIQALVDEFEGLDTSSQRVEFITRLDPDTREAFQKARRQPDQRLPIIGPIERRFRPGRGGQLAETGRDIAEERFNISGEQTVNASRVLREVSDGLLTEQQTDDEALRSGGMQPEIWRQQRAARFEQYSGAILSLKETHPQSVQAQLDPEITEDYYDTVATLGGAVRDRRDRAQLLANSWYAIRPEEISRGVNDMDTFFTVRDEFLNRLSTDDRAILEAYLDARRTETEVEYANDLDTLKDYFNVGNTFVTEVAGRFNAPELIADYGDYKRFNAIGDDFAARVLLEKQYPADGRNMQLLKLLINVGIPAKRNEIRLADTFEGRQIDALLVKWGFDPQDRPRNPGNLREAAPELRERALELLGQ